MSPYKAYGHHLLFPLLGKIFHDNNVLNKSFFLTYSLEPTLTSILVTNWPMSSLQSGMLGLKLSRLVLKLRGMTWKLSWMGQNNRLNSNHRLFKTQRIMHQKCMNRYLFMKHI